MQRIDIAPDRWRVIDRFESVDSRHLPLSRTGRAAVVVEAAALEVG